MGLRFILRKCAIPVVVPVFTTVLCTCKKRSTGVFTFISTVIIVIIISIITLLEPIFYTISTNRLFTGIETSIKIRLVPIITLLSSFYYRIPTNRFTKSIAFGFCASVALCWENFKIAVSLCLQRTNRTYRITAVCWARNFS